MMKMYMLVLSLVASCGSSPEKSNMLPDGPGMQIADARKATLPTWMLEDIQPQSPRVGQTYGLQTFGGKIVVVTLLEGF